MEGIRIRTQETYRGFKSRLGDLKGGKWHRDPLVKAPSGTASEFLALHDEARSRVYPDADAVEDATGFAIDRAWIDELALHTQIVKKRSQLAYPHGRLLYSLLRRYIADSDETSVTIFETGTARGFSALCMAKAIEDARVQGRIVTFDLLPHITPIYWNCIDDLDGRKSRAELLAPWSSLLEKVVFIEGDTILMLPKVGVSRINFAFLDAQHTRTTVLKEFEVVAALQRTGDVLFFDDVTPAMFPGVVAAVDGVEETGMYKMNRLTISDQRSYAWGIRN